MLAFPKYTTPLAIERQTKRAARVSHERTEKAKVRRRDVRCRWPKPHECAGRLEVAHLNAKGMGGDHGVRTEARQMILCCWNIHQGAVSLHSGDLYVLPLTNKGTDGPCAFYQRTHATAVEIGNELTSRKFR